VGDDIKSDIEFLKPQLRELQEIYPKIEDLCEQDISPEGSPQTPALDEARVLVKALMFQSCISLIRSLGV